MAAVGRDFPTTRRHCVHFVVPVAVENPSWPLLYNDIRGFASGLVSSTFIDFNSKVCKRTFHFLREIVSSEIWNELYKVQRHRQHLRYVTGLLSVFF